MCRLTALGHHMVLLCQRFIKGRGLTALSADTSFITFSFSLELVKPPFWSLLWSGLPLGKVSCTLWHPSLQAVTSGITWGRLGRGNGRQSISLCFWSLNLTMMLRRIIIRPWINVSLQRWLGQLSWDSIFYASSDWKGWNPKGQDF